MTRSLFGKLLASYVGIIFLTLTVVILVLSGLFSSYYFSVKERELVGRGQEIASLLSASLSEQRSKETIDFFRRTLRSNENTRFLIVDKEGLSLLSSQGLPGSPDLSLQPADSRSLLQGQVMTWEGFNRRLNQPILAAAVPFQVQEQVAGAVFLFTPVADINATVAAVRRLIFYSAGVAIFLALIPGYFLSRSISRPIRQMSNLTLEMAQGNFGQQVPVTSRDEVGQLAENFNHLAVNLEQTVSALLQEKVKNENILVNLTEGVIATNRQGQVFLFNPGAENVLGIKQEEVLHQPLESFAGGRQLAALFREAMETDEQQAGEFMLAGGDVYLLVRVAPLRQKEREIYGAVGVLQDITGFKKLDQLRRDFIADVSHELRTPLTSIQGFSEALLDGVTTEKTVQEEYLRVIHRESLRLNRLINELLDLALLESGKISWELNAIEAPDLFARVLFKLKPQLKEKQIEVSQEITPGLPLFLGNEERIEQVLTNLLQNAIRFSTPGGIIKMTASSFGEEGMITISDQGPGIPAQDLPYIWERFYRVEKSRSRALGGTGLGLAIVKQIVEKHGGKVRVSSQEGAGSTFYFTLPVMSEENDQEE